MITSSNSKYSEAHQKDKFVLAGGRENLTCDSRGKVYHTGGVAPKGAPSVKRITGGGELTMDVGYSYAYTYFNRYQDCETAPSPASAYVGAEGEGTFKTVRIDGLYVYVAGSGLEKTDGYYNGHVIACEIVNDEYVNVHSQWQYRTVTEYLYDAVNEQGRFTINRAFFNVDPDEDDQQYTVRLDDLDMEEGRVGGKAKGNNKLVLDPDSSQSPSNYRLKVIHITQGRGKGQKRIIMDAVQREDGLVEITVDAPWKEKPKFVDEDKKDVYKEREKAEGQKGTKRNKGFYKRYYSSEYAISDPMRYNGLCLDANVLSYDNKSRRVRLSGLGHSDGLITGTVISYKDNSGTTNDTVTLALAGDDGATESSDSYVNKRFRIYEGNGAGLDCLIKGVAKSSETRVTLKLDTFGKLSNRKKDIPNFTSKCVIYGGEALSTHASVSKTTGSSEGATTKSYDLHPRIFSYTIDKQTGEAVLRCVHGGGSSHDMAYIRAGELGNAETYSNGKCYVMFKIYYGSSKDKAYYITRPIVSAAAVDAGGEDSSYLQLKVSGIPTADSSWPTIVTAKSETEQDIDNEGSYFVHQDNLQDGYYTGWVAAFYNTADTRNKGQKKVSSSRVAGYIDATGEIILTNGVAGIGEGWQCTLYSEYSRCIGSRVKVYNEDSYAPSYTSASNSRFFCLDYFASDIDDEYKDWKFEILYGTAKKVKGQNIYKQDKNRKQYSVFAYDGKSRRIDCAGDENFSKGVRMKPAPAGDEFVTVYDPASYIFKIFETDGDDSDSTSEASGESGCKMKVDGILPSTLPGFDQIRLYRASDTTATYRLCATLDNIAQQWVDNSAESELGQELDFAHSAPNSAKYVTERNARFALAGASVTGGTLTAIGGISAMLEGMSLASGASHLEVGRTYVCGDYSGTVSARQPAIGARLSPDVWLEIPQPGENRSANIDMKMLVGDAGNGVYCGVSRQKESDVTRAETVTFMADPYWWPDPGQPARTENYFNTFSLSPVSTFPVNHGLRSCGIQTGSWALNSALGAETYVVDCDGFVLAQHALPPEGQITITRYHQLDTAVDYETLDIRNDLEFRSIVMEGVKLYVYKFRKPFYHDASGSPVYYRRLCCRRFNFGKTNEFALLETQNPVVCVPSGNKPEFREMEDGTYVLESDSFYLAASSSNNPQAYSKSTLRFVDANGGEHHWNFGTDITYDSGTKLVKLASGSVLLKVKKSDLGVEYNTVRSGSSYDVVKTVYSDCYQFIPSPYQIYEADWQIYKTASGWFKVDSEHTSAVPVTATPVGATGLLAVSATLPQSQNDEYSRIVLGGPSHCQTNGTSASFTLYYVGFSQAGRKDEMISSYLLGALELAEKWNSTGETTSVKPFATVPPCEGKASSASVYVQHDSSIPPVPKVPASGLRKFLPGKSIVAMSATFDGQDGERVFSLKDGDLEVQITTAGAGLREKVELENLYNLNDGYGTKITGIVSYLGGFVVFKDMGLYMIDPDARRMQCFTHEFGCIAPGSIVEGRSGFAWMSNGGRIQLQNFGINSPTTEIGKELKPWFDGDFTIGGLSIDWSRIEAETEATYDSEHGDYIFALPCTKSESGVPVQCTAIMVWNENYRQWWRIDDTRSANSVKCGFRYEGHGAFAGLNGIYSFRKNRLDTVTNPWKYESRWRDEGASDREKLVKSLHLNQVVDHSRTDQPTATMTYYKDQKETPEPNFLTYSGGSSAHAFYTNQPKANVAAGVRGYEWRFVMEGSSYLRLKGIDTEFRKKDDLGPDLINSPKQNE